MNVELLAFTLTLALALIGAFGVFYEKNPNTKKLAAALTLLFAILGSITGYELSTRKSKDSLDAEVERRWLLIQNAEIKYIEFEILNTHSVSDKLQLVTIAKQFTINFDKIDMAAEVGLPNSNGIAMEDVFSADNLSSPDRIGAAVADVQTNKATGKSIVRNIRCMSSNYTLHKFINNNNLSNDSAICSIAIRLPLKKRHTLQDLLQTNNIEMYAEPSSIICIGDDCSYPVISIKLILDMPSDTHMFPSMVEISPLLYNVPYSPIDAHFGQFIISGNIINELAKSIFKERFGYLENIPFRNVYGTFEAIYARLTSSSETVRIVDVIWTTESSATYSTLEHAIGPDYREGVIHYNADEWCGFGENKTCWYRYVVAVPEKKAL